MHRCNYLLLLIAVALASAISRSVAAEDTLPGGAMLRLGAPSTAWKMHHMATAAISRDGKQVVFCSGDKTLTIMDPATGKRLRSFTTDKIDMKYQPRFTADCKCLYYAIDDLYVLIDAVSGKEIARIELPPPKPSVSTVFASHNLYYPSFAGKTLAVSASLDNNKPIKNWDVLANKSLGEIQPNQNNDSHYCSWSQDGSLLAISGYRHDKKKPEDEASNEYVDLWDIKAMSPRSPTPAPAPQPRDPLPARHSLAQQGASPGSAECQHRGNAPGRDPR